MKEMTVEARTENIVPVTGFIDGILEANGCSVKAQAQIDVAVDEIFSNIARYAYGDSRGMARIAVDVDGDGGCVTISFTDSGRPYDPLGREDPDITLSAEDREIGGLGIWIVKNTMDDVSYSFEDGRNVLRIRKRIR